jgi:hypothetical protein
VNYINGIDSETDDWINKLDYDHTKIWAKLGGSDRDSKNPIVKCEFLFTESNDPKTIFEAVISINIKCLVHEVS